MTKKNFYCSGSPHGEFTFENYNNQLHLAIAMGIEDEVTLPGEYDCMKQCERCLNIIIEHHRKKGLPEPPKD